MFFKIETILLTKILLGGIKTILQIQEKYKIIQGKAHQPFFKYWETTNVYIFNPEQKMYIFSQAKKSGWKYLKIKKKMYADDTEDILCTDFILCHLETPGNMVSHCPGWLGTHWAGRQTISSQRECAQ